MTALETYINGVQKILNNKYKNIKSLINITIAIDYVNKSSKYLIIFDFTKHNSKETWHYNIIENDTEKQIKHFEKNYHITITLIWLDNNDFEHEQILGDISLVPKNEQMHDKHLEKIFNISKLFVKYINSK